MMGAWPAFAAGFVSRAVRESWLATTGLATFGEVGDIRGLILLCRGWIPRWLNSFGNGD